MKNIDKLKELLVQEEKDSEKLLDQGQDHYKASNLYGIHQGFILGIKKAIEIIEMS